MLKNNLNQDETAEVKPLAAQGEQQLTVSIPVTVTQVEVLPEAAKGEQQLPLDPDPMPDDKPPHLGTEKADDQPVVQATPSPPLPVILSPIHPGHEDNPPNLGTDDQPLANTTPPHSMPAMLSPINPGHEENPPHLGTDEQPVVHYTLAVV